MSRKKGTNKRALAGVMEWKEYREQLNEDEQAWVDQFYKEYYANGRYNYEEPLLTTEDQKKEANRNSNSLYRDAFSVSRMLNNQAEISEDQREVYELASDEADWEVTLNQQGEDAATSLIMEQAVRDLDAGQDKKVVLSRFYVKMRRLNKTIQQEKRRQR